MEKKDQNASDKDPTMNESWQKPSNTDTTEPKEQPSTTASPPELSIEVTAPAADDAEYVTGVKLIIVMTSITLVAFLVMLDISIVSTAVPRITSDFHSLGDVGWYGSAYLLASASLQPLTGKLYSYFNSKSTFLTFFAFFELGSLLCGVAVDSNMLIIGRAVAGCGNAGLSNGALMIISACVPLEKRPFYFGILLSVAQIGIVLGPLIGGALTQYTTWRWCFFINLPIGAAVAVFLFMIRIPDQSIKSSSATDRTTIRTKLAKLDLPGFIIFAPAAIQFLLALEWGGTRYPWSSATVIGLLCGATGTFAVFLAWEYSQGDAAMIPFSMLCQRVIASSCLVTFFFFGSMLILAYYLPIYFQAVRDATPTLSGVYMLPVILSQMIFAVLSGFLVSKYGYYIIWSAISGVLTGIGLGLISTYTVKTPTRVWIGYQIIAGAGRGCGLQMPIVAIQNALPKERVSIGMSLLIFSQTFGGALFLTFAETAFTNGLAQALSTFAPEVSPEVVINAGATALRDVVPNSSLPGVLLAYNQAISHAFYLAAGASVSTFIFSWGMGWVAVKKESVETAAGKA